MIATPTDQVEPFFFGPRARQLYGCYHEPSAWPSRETGVVVCYPAGQEYIRSHRACHHLAVHAARAGFPVLRFDYFGTGDSQGDDQEGDFNQWRADLRQAVDELCARGGVDQVVLAGLRLGASLALSTASQISNVRGLILWEPVVNGQTHIEELQRRHAETIMRFFVQPKDYNPNALPTELLGFAISEAQLRAIQSIDLLTIRPPSGKPVLLVENQGNPELAACAKHLESTGRLTYQQIASFTTWVEDVDKGLVPQPVIEAITHWLEQEVV
jgi:pimeloyl-ACP methyl ester carboxylesterase